MTRYQIVYGLDECITVDTLDQMAIFTAGLAVKGNSYSVAKIEE